MVQTLNAPRRRPIEYIPARDDLAGDTVGDDIRHVIARTALLNALLGDDAVQETLTLWAERQHLWEKAYFLFHMLRELAKATGGAHWYDALPALRRLLAGIPVTGELDMAVRIAHDIFHDSLVSEGATGDLRRALEELFASRGIRWAWLVLDLNDYFVNGFYAFVTAGVQVRQTLSAAGQTQAHSVDIGTVEIQPGESNRDLAKRVVAQLRQRQTESSKPKGRVPGKARATLQRYTHWFYRRRVRGDSLKQIARTEFPDEVRAADERRSHVKVGIREAERCLSLSPHRF